MVQSIKKLWPVLIVLAFVAGRYSMPSKVEIKEVEKIVKVEVESKEKREKGTIHEIEKRRSDGSVEIERTTVYDNTEVNKKETKSSHEKTSITKMENLPDYQVGALYRLSSKDDSSNRFTVVVNRRLLGSIYGGAYVKPDSELEYGISLSVGF
jgi:hypothetical protein